MNRNPESTKTAHSDRAANEKPEAAAETVAHPFTALFQSNLERYARIQKETLDMLAQQSIEAVEALKKTLNVPANTPGVGGLDLAVQGIASLVESEKKIVNVIVEQSSITLDGTKEYGSAASKQMDVATELLRKATDRAVEMQRLALDMAAQQNKLVVEAVKQQPWASAVAPSVAAAAESMQRGMNAAVEAQKEFLDSASQPLKAKAARA